ncbi:hypothetical protein E2C01_086311 [Portunus trituberculatus]|uniref:Spaetzle domain-containing protein n=2 Tax=Portunus trituberculatus TaxID=210409 RepID=A0A5B7JD41_PORTR|nr:hypothetical protein [Portunus trituberculatus]
MTKKILARYDDYASRTAATIPTTTTTTTTNPLHLLPHRRRHHHQLRPYNLHLSPRAAKLAEEMVDEQPPQPSHMRYSQEFLQYEDSTPENDLLAEQVEMMEQEEEEEEDMIRRYRIAEELDDLTRNKREKGEGKGRRRSCKKQRNERRQECRKRRQRYKQLRLVKKRRRIRYRNAEKMFNDTIPVFVDRSGIEYIDCCPSELKSFNKTVGKSHLHETMEIKPGYEAFTERLCLEVSRDKECIIPGNALKPEVSTRCVQQYSYSQALVRPLNSTDDVEWMVGSIQVGSGCSCQMSTNHKKKKRKRKRR